MACDSYCSRSIGIGVAEQKKQPITRHNKSFIVFFLLVVVFLFYRLALVRISSLRVCNRLPQMNLAKVCTSQLLLKYFSSLYLSCSQTFVALSSVFWNPVVRSLIRTWFQLKMKMFLRQRCQICSSRFSVIVFIRFALSNSYLTREERGKGRAGKQTRQEKKGGSLVDCCCCCYLCFCCAGIQIN